MNSDTLTAEQPNGSQQLPSSLSEKLQSFSTLYATDKILQCARLLKELNSTIHTLEAGNPSDRVIGLLLRQNLEQQSYFKQALTDCAQLTTLLSALDDVRDWTLSYDGVDTKVWYRRETETSSHSVRIRGTLHAPLLNVLALVYEVDLYQSLFWFFSSSTQLPVNHSSDLRLGAHVVTSAPWPLHDRDSVFYGFAVDALDEDRILVVCHSILDEDPVKNIPSPASGVVRATCHDSGFELKPISPDVTEAHFVYNFDPHLPFVPMAVINWATRTFCRWSLRLLESRAQRLHEISSQYTSRMRAPVYERIRLRLESYWNSKGVPFEDTFGRTAIGATSQDSRRPSDFDEDVQPHIPASILKTLLSGGTVRTGENVQEGQTLRKKLSAKLLGRKDAGL